MARQQLLWSDLHGMDFAELTQVRPRDPVGRLFRRHGRGPGSAVLVADGPARLLPGADAERLDRDRFALDSLHRLWSARAKTVGGQTLGVGLVLTAVCVLDTVLALLLVGRAHRGALLVVGLVCGIVGVVVIALSSRAVSAYSHGIALTAALVGSRARQLEELTRQDR